MRRRGLYERLLSEKGRNAMLTVSQFNRGLSIVLIGVLGFGLMPAKAQTAPLTSADIEHRIDDLLSQMTLEEKLGQMSQKGFPEPFSETAKDEIRHGRWGSLYNGGTAAEKAEAQRIAITESRLHIPLIYAHDIIHGFRTTYPIPLGESATWNPEMIRQSAHLTAIEATREGEHWTFAPMMDIGRDARWGRIAETLGEDPYLSGVMAAAMVQGFQGDSLSAPDSIAACGKHYVGYGAAEAGRDYNTTWIPQQLLRNVYLVPFHAAELAGAASFMSAFNDLNGVPASANEFTLRQVLRNEWGFGGMVVSDYQAVTELIPHGYAADDADAALKCIRAGVDMEMVSTAYYDKAKQLIDSGQLDPKLIDDAVGNILRLKFRLGLFGDKGLAKPASPAAPDAQTLDMAKKIAEQSLVLLKDENGALPLSQSVGKVAVIGPLADSAVDQLGSWAVGGEEYVQTPLASLRARLGDARVLWAPGLKTSRDASHDGFAAAVDAANNADVVLLFLGEEAAMSGEAASRTTLNLPGAQEDLVAEIAKTGKPMIAVIMAGRPLTFHETAAKMSAVLWSFDPGTMGGPAIVDTLFGDSVPSGKLTVTFPRTVGQCPIYYDHMNTGRPAWADGPASKDKYTSKYIDVSFTPEYPFGYGLSYAHFQYSNLRLSSSEMKLGGQIQISADITNIGNVKADEIVQFYTRQRVGSLTRPVRELRSFRRVTLEPGQTQTVDFNLASQDLAFYNGQGQLVTEPGEFHVWIAPDSASGLFGQFNLVQ
jgi:beta-glucosidase